MEEKALYAVSEYLGISAYVTIYYISLYLFSVFVIVYFILSYFCYCGIIVVNSKYRFIVASLERSPMVFATSLPVVGIAMSIMPIVQSYLIKTPNCSATLDDECKKQIIEIFSNTRPLIGVMLIGIVASIVVGSIFAVSLYYRKHHPCKGSSAIDHSPS